MTGTDALIAVALTLVGVAGTAVVASHVPERQAVTLSTLGLLLAVAFVLLGAPDVALSQLAVGTAVVPLMVLLAVRRIRRQHEDDTGGPGGAADAGEERR